MAANSDLEIEIKIQLESFMDYLKLLGYLGPIDRKEYHQNAFFDTPERELGQAGYVLRVRSAELSGSVTLKSLVSQTDALAVRQEMIGEIGAVMARAIMDGHTDLMSLNVAPIAYLRSHFPKLAPVLLLKFANERQVKRYRLGELELDLEIDRTEFSDGSVEYELEIELSDQSHYQPVRDAVARIFQSLAIPFVTQTKSKFERALARG
jgi:inorganic triphosphatase YgiF